MARALRGAVQIRRPSTHLLITQLRLLALTLVFLPLVLGFYAYVGYPLLLAALARLRPRVSLPPQPSDWPLITITVPCYNEAASIRATIESLLALDYPADRRQIMVISDASTDGTDEVVREFAGRGVELLRLPERRGKSAAENAAAAVARGDIIVNTDATIRILPGALKPLVSAFGDPRVGVASGRDVSVSPAESAAPGGEAGYVGYEMEVRALETRVGSIVGASGCFYGIRRSLYQGDFPETLSRDFASALVARENGYRAVSVNEAVCLVPRTGVVRAEFRRKTRTMARGLQTLLFKRRLLNPLEYGSFACMLLSHKLCRWLVYPALPLALVGLAVLAAGSRFWAIVLALAVAGIATGVAAMRWPRTSRPPAPIALAGFVLGSCIAGVLAWVHVAQRRNAAVWEPTRRIA